MKKVSLVALSVVILSVGALWAGRGHNKGWLCADDEKVEAKIEKKVKRMSKKLDLSADQKEQVRSILKKKVTKMQSLAKAFYEEKDAARQEFKSEIRGILNEEQQATFEKKMEKKKGRHKKKRGDCAGK